MKPLHLTLSTLLCFLITGSLSKAQQASEKKASLEVVDGKISLFDHLYQLEGTPTITITTDINTLVREKMEEVYQEATILFPGKQEGSFLQLPAKIKTRGNMRKKVSYLPPVKLDFEKSALDSCGFLKMDDLKIVFPATSDKHSEKHLLKEFLAYQIYSLIDSNYMHTRLVNFSIVWKDKEKYQFTGFIIEDNDEYARRKNLKVIDQGKLIAEALDRTSFLKMLFFQYMIANTDWGIDSRHNIEMVKMPDLPRAIAMPYDFDYSGFVGQDYAVPDPRLKIETVHERFFFPAFHMKEEEFEAIAAYYLSIEQAVYDLCMQANYLDEKSRNKCVSYLEPFFKLLKEKSELKTVMVR